MFRWRRNYLFDYGRLFDEYKKQYEHIIKFLNAQRKLQMQRHFFKSWTYQRGKNRFNTPISPPPINSNYNSSVFQPPCTGNEVIHSSGIVHFAPPPLLANQTQSPSHSDIIYQSAFEGNAPSTNGKSNSINKAASTVSIQPPSLLSCTAPISRDSFTPRQTQPQSPANQTKPKQRRIKSRQRFDLSSKIAENGDPVPIPRQYRVSEIVDMDDEAIFDHFLAPSLQAFTNTHVRNTASLIASHFPYVGQHHESDDRDDILSDENSSQNIHRKPMTRSGFAQRRDRMATGLQQLAMTQPSIGDTALALPDPRYDEEEVPPEYTHIESPCESDRSFGFDQEEDAIQRINRRQLTRSATGQRPEPLAKIPLELVLTQRTIGSSEIFFTNPSCEEESQVESNHDHHSSSDDHRLRRIDRCQLTRSDVGPRPERLMKMPLKRVLSHRNIGSTALTLPDTSCEDSSSIDFGAMAQKYADLYGSDMSFDIDFDSGSG